MRKIRLIPSIVAIGIGLTGFGAASRPIPFIVYNASASAPLGFYIVQPAGLLYRGELVLVRTPQAVRQLAAERGYVPATVPLVKRIAALPGESICASGRAIAINGRHVADRLAADRRGRAMPSWTGCRTLGPEEVFPLMSGVRDSFDGRYFGPVSKQSIIGKLAPLWVR